MDPQTNDSNYDKIDETPITPSSEKGPRSRSGWDGKLRVEKKPLLVNPEALTDPEYSDEEAPPAEQINADEGL